MVKYSSFGPDGRILFLCRTLTLCTLHSYILASLLMDGDQLALAIAVTDGYIPFRFVEA